MAQRWHGFWHHASPLRAASETLLVAALCALVAVVITRHATETADAFILRDNLTLVLLAGPFVALWCATRMRLHAGAWWRGIPYDAAIGVVLGVLPAVIMLVTEQGLLAQRSSIGRAAQAFENRIPLWEVLAIALVGFAAEFVIFRLGVRLWLYWNRIRRTRLRWALTHALLSIAGLAAGLLTALILFMQVMTRGFSGTLTFNVIPILFFLAFLTALGLAVVLPPSALFSYLFARHVTQRLQALAKATSALRAGDYRIRVPVTGEDEVAQLQNNFNAMAADLDRAVSEVHAERDNVAALLSARRELVASVSHELRTPVATLRGYLESTLTHWNGSPPPTLRRDLEVMERETVRLQTLINDLFTLARAEVGHLELRMAPTAVDALAHHVVETMAPLAWQSGRVEVVAEVAPDVPLAQVDGSRLEQVLQNLLHNAVRHTPPGGIVVVNVRAEAEAVVLRVQDTGEGIAAEEMSRIWGRFYRAGKARARSDGGSGLGLALVKELTEAMGGTVAAESVTGEGSSFTVRVPWAPASAPTTVASPAQRDERGSPLAGVRP
jgi:signal transduction histidine kinase